MSGMTLAYAAVLVPAVYLWTGAIGLMLVTVSSAVRLQGAPPVLRGADGFWNAFRIGMRAVVTWPWTWKRWTDG